MLMVVQYIAFVRYEMGTVIEWDLGGMKIMSRENEASDGEEIRYLFRRLDECLARRDQAPATASLDARSPI